MSIDTPRGLIEVAYEAAAQEYLRRLPLEHFMEAYAQGRQREITLESLALVRARRPDVYVFNEMLVQYPRPGRRRPGQVVPDNMIVISDQPIRASSSFNTPLEPEGPFWVMEYVSKHNKRKDYEDDFDKYEKHLRVPYYLVFFPDNQEMTLYRLQGEKYQAVPPNGQGRCAVPQLEMEVGLLDGWVRFWYRGELLPLPDALLRALDAARRQMEEAKQQAQEAERRASAAEQRAEEEKRRAEEEKRRAEELNRRLEAAERELSLFRARPPSPPETGAAPTAGATD